MYASIQKALIIVMALMFQKKYFQDKRVFALHQGDQDSNADNPSLLMGPGQPLTSMLPHPIFIVQSDLT